MEDEKPLKERIVSAIELYTYILSPDSVSVPELDTLEMGEEQVKDFISLVKFMSHELADERGISERDVLMDLSARAQLVCLS